MNITTKTYELARDFCEEYGVDTKYIKKKQKR